MLSRTCLLGVAAVGFLAACTSSDDREWMKVNERYSVDEFRRDHAACSKSGKLDDACMRSRGWVDVRSGGTDKPAPDQRRRPIY